MSTLGERLRIAREKKGFTQVQVKDRTNINNKTLSGYEKNVSEPDAKTISVLADLYEVSYRWLLTGKGNIDHRTSLTEKDERDIAKRIERFREDLENSDGLAFDGEPLSEEAKESLIESMEHIFRMTQRINKKYIPKKYRNDDPDK